MDDHLVMLQARIIAQEFLMRAVLTGSLMSNADPFSALDQVRRDFRATFQNAERPVGEDEDAIMEAAVAAVFNELDQVENRLRDQLGR